MKHFCQIWNDLCQVTWEHGNNPTKVLYNCRKNVQPQFNFTTAKKMYNCYYFISQSTAISFHNCEKIVQL